MTEINGDLQTNLMDHIRKCIRKAECENIKRNMIIIDRDIAITNHLYYGYDVYGEREVRGYPPMLFGLEVKYLENLTKDVGANFVITEGPTVEGRMKALEEENARLRKQLNQIKELLNI